MGLTEQGLQEIEAFNQTWPLDRLKQMSLPEYTNSDRDSAFIYWLEKKTEHAGSIWGGSAFKFGIYKRANTELVEKKMYRTDGTYAWLAKFGETAEEAFSKVKDLILQIVDASVVINFDKIESIELGDVVKWKIAHLYNPTQVIPIFNKQMLLRSAEGSGIKVSPASTVGQLQKAILSKKGDDQDTLDFARAMWEKFSLENFYPTIEKFLEQAQTDSLKKSGYPNMYKGLTLRVGFGAGNKAAVPWIAFLKKPNEILSGIYPVYLYYMAHNVLILAHGVSETNKPPYDWPNTGELSTIAEWFRAAGLPTPSKYGESYVKAVYELKEPLNPEQMQSDLDGIVAEYVGVKLAGEWKNGREEPEQPQKIWLISPGVGAQWWEYFYENGRAGFGWGELGDLRKYSSKEDIRDILKLDPDVETNQSHTALSLWEFSREMHVGDIVIAKKGTSHYLGYGIVTGSYYFDEANDTCKHHLPVQWKKKGSWEESSGPIVTKILTDITKYPEYVDRLKRVIGIEQEATVDVNSIEYYWLNANPKYWKIEDYQVGQEQWYTTHNDQGNKRSRFEYFKKIRSGDLVLGYATTPIQKVVAIFEVTKGAHLDEDSGQEVITFKIQKFLPNPVSFDTIKGMPEMKGAEVVRNNQGSLFRLTKEEYNAIVHKDLKAEVTVPPYTIEQAEKEIFLDREGIERIINTLNYKKNIILQGPPGVGKTYMAKRIAYLMMEEKDNSKIEMVQFHQSYSYEDFIQGYRPRENGTFALENGAFYRFCRRAQTDPGHKYFFIIDEINRGNLSKIFGELMLLLEADKRGKEDAVTLTYSPSSETKFHIPENVFLIGTMNTADRSLALVDYALRRRFAFIDVAPSFNQKFKEELINAGVDEALLNHLVGRIADLNKEIEKDPNLRKGFQIGHSYFCNIPQGGGDIEWYQGIIQYEIVPLLHEYWFDKEEKASIEISRLAIK